MAYLTLAVPALALAGALLIERLERWALVPLDPPVEHAEVRRIGTPPDERSRRV